MEVLLGHTEDFVADDFHAWRYPVLVLDADLQTGHGISPPKWSPRARTGKVVLVIDLQTAHVSPQYHIVFDDEFSTVPYLQSQETPYDWADFDAKHTEKATDQAFNLAFTWYEGEETDKDDIMPQTST
eukprot:13099401-Ditylum_brightwellii.AAC.1